MGTRQPAEAQVIVVEDDKDANAIIAGLLKLKGYQPYKAHSAEECLKLLEKHDGKIDAISINGKISLENGGMLVSRINRINPNTKILVIANSEDDRTKLLQYSVDHLDIKPLSAESVVDKITVLLASSGALLEQGTP